MNRTLLPTLAAAVAVLGGAQAVAQSNAVAGRDLALEDTWDLTMGVRGGTYPNGVGAVGPWTTICNPGTSAVQFQAAMDARHAFIHYIIVRVTDQRIEQISNYGYVKHTFGSSNDPSSCGSCAGSGRFSFVEVGCSDTYAGIQARDHFNLGPPDEIDPWLGTWVPQCSLFDRGDPAVGQSQICDGTRSLTQNQANNLNTQIHNQILVKDQDLLAPNSLFYFQSGYLVPGEPAANRLDNLGSRQFTPSWNGSNWIMADGDNYLNGTILFRWPGTTVTSNTNGQDDGRFYVGCHVTGPVDGIYHYEYAIQNADNKRGLGSFRLPVCATASVTNIGFRDIDDDPLNNWTSARTSTEISWTTSNNPVRWNAIYNFWFDSDAAPTNSAISLDQFDLGPGAATVAVNSRAPTGLFNENIGAGCGNGTVPALFAAGAPARAALPNPSFELRAKDCTPISVVVFAYSNVVGTTNVGSGCTVYSGDIGSMGTFEFAITDANGRATSAQPVPNIPAFEGLTLDVQAANLVTSGAWLGTINLSNGLRLRIGNNIAGCP